MINDSAQYFVHRQLDHPNLCKFIGGSIEVPYVSVITEHCPKGSLSDVLLNDDIPINWGFRQGKKKCLCMYIYLYFVLSAPSHGDEKTLS